MLNDEERRNKLKDIETVDFGASLEEITSSMEILLMLFEFDDDPLVIQACKKRLLEGVEILKQLNYENITRFDLPE